MTEWSENQFRQSVLDAAERLQGKLIRYASRFVSGDESAARDVVQHAFLQLCRVDVTSRPERVDAWLFRVCRNKAIDLQRREDRFRTGQQLVIHEQLDASQTTEEKLDRHEVMALIQNRIQTLPQSQREAIELWSNGFRYAEVAEIMDKNETTVRVIVHRAITRLRRDPAIQEWIGAEPFEKQTASCKQETTI